MNFILITGTPSSRTNYTQRLLSNHPGIADCGREVNMADMTQLRVLSDTAKYGLVSSWQLWQYLDEVQSLIPDITIIETQRSWYNVMISLSYKFPQICTSQRFRHYLSRQGINNIPDITAPPAIGYLSFIYAIRHACSKHKTTIFTTDNYKSQVEKLQERLNLEVIPFDELVTDPFTPEQHNKIAPQWLNNQINKYYKEESQFWINKIESLSND